MFMFSELDNGLFAPPPILTPEKVTPTHTSTSTNHASLSVGTETETNGNYDNGESSSANTSMESMGIQTSPIRHPRMATTPTQTADDLDAKEQEKKGGGLIVDETQ